MAITRQKFTRGAFFALLLATVLIWYAVIQSTSGVLTVAFLDVGQGDAIFIESPNGNQMLIDGGSGSSVLRALSSVMPFYDRSIDVVVATHPDEDHIGGLPDVLRHYSTSYLLRSGAKSDTGVYLELNAIGETESVEQIVAKRGMVVDFGDGAYAEILFPDRDVSNVDSNSASIVIRVVYGESEFMLTGDAPKAVEEYLVSLAGDSSGKSLRSDVLKAGHHGSKTASSELFLGVVAPEYAVFSSGKDNRYGHPHKEVVDRFKRFGIPTLNTADEGTIVFKTDGRLLWRP